MTNSTEVKIFIGKRTILPLLHRMRANGLKLSRISAGRSTTGLICRHLQPPTRLYISMVPQTLALVCWLELREVKEHYRSFSTRFAILRGSRR